MRFLLSASWVASGLVALSICGNALGQSTNRPTRQWRAEVVSPSVHDDRNVTFRILAPNADNVRLAGSDLPGVGQGKDMAKGTNGIWEITVEGVKPGAYRYTFNVDGVPVVDPRNPATSESNMNTWSLVYVPGSDTSDTRDVPHGAVASLTYYSKTLEKFRRLHVYTPPGYELGAGKYPVFYLLHGASDSDNSWSTVGRASFILDNLIATGKAKPMVVVMPAGHIGPFGFGATIGQSRDEFTEDFNTEIRPLIEKRYRIQNDRSHRAIAGLSMGGAQTLNVAIPKLDQFAYIGVFSSGVFARGNDGLAAWTSKHEDKLQDKELRNGLKLVWFSTGKDDFLVQTSRNTVEALKKHGFDVVYKESDGGHTWDNWREYLAEFVPQLFRD